MAKWIFVAKVLPERVPVSIGEPVSGETKDENGQTVWKFKLLLHLSQAVVQIEMEDEALELFSTRNWVAQLVASHVDLIGYLNGLSFDVDVVSAFCADSNSPIVFGCEIPILRAAKPPTTEISGQLLATVASDTTIQMILEDFRHAMRIPVGTGFFCFRAIEAMMQSVKTHAGEKDRDAWQRLRDHLRVDRATIEYIKKHADFPRHGRAYSISDSERAKIFQSADEIIRRFIEYVLRGFAPLAEAEFPILKNEPPEQGELAS